MVKCYIYVYYQGRECDCGIHRGGGPTAHCSGPGPVPGPSPRASTEVVYVDTEIGSQGERAR